MSCSARHTIGRRIGAIRILLRTHVLAPHILATIPHKYAMKERTCGTGATPRGRCMPETKSGRGFQLLSGDADKGKHAFAALKCHNCHTVEGVPLPPTAERPLMAVKLGGEVSQLRTYGELATAIIHLSLDVSLNFPAGMASPGTKAPMRDVTAEMTVAQLRDIVTFLEPLYRHVEPEYMAGLPYAFAHARTPFGSGGLPAAEGWSSAKSTFRLHVPVDFRRRVQISSR